MEDLTSRRGVRLLGQDDRTQLTFVRESLTSARQGNILGRSSARVLDALHSTYAIGANSLVMAVFSPLLALKVANVRRLLLAVIILDIPLPLDIHLGYRVDAAIHGALVGLNVSVTTISLVLLYALWLSEFLSKQANRPRPMFRKSLPLALYLAFVALSVLVAHDVELSTFQIFLLLQMLLLHIYIASTVRTRQEVLFIVTMLLVGLLLESLIMIGQQLTGRGLSITAISNRIDPGDIGGGHLSRLGGTVGSPNNAGAYLSVLLALAMSILFTRLGRWIKSLAVLAFGLGSVALILTFSRGGWVAFAVSITILCLLAACRGWLSPKVSFAIAAVALPLFLLFQGIMLTRLEDHLGAAYSRVPLMRLAFRIIEDNPVLGVGANNFAAVMDQYVTSELSGEWLYTVHNKYLLIWSEAGTGALVAFLWFLGSTLRQGWHCYKFRDRFVSPIALGFMAATIGHMTHMFVEVFNGRPLIQLLTLITALIAAMRSRVSVMADTP